MPVSILIKKNSRIYIHLIKINIEGAEYDLLDKTDIASLAKAKNIILELNL